MPLITHHGAESGPNLPLHYQSPSDHGWSTLGRALGTNSRTQNEARHELILPGVCESFPNRCSRSDEAGDPYRTTATQPVIKRLVQPAAEYCARKIWSSHYEADDIIKFGFRPNILFREANKLDRVRCEDTRNRDGYYFGVDWQRAVIGSLVHSPSCSRK